MQKDILIILVGNRDETAVEVQKILTSYGAIIKTRLGIHENMCCQNNSDRDCGLIILELVGTEDKNNELLKKLSLLKDVNAKLVNISLNNK